MKRILFLLTIISLTANIAVSMTDTAEISSPQYLRQQGFSEEAIRLINREKREENTVAVPEKKQSQFVKYVNGFFNYIDPDKAHHDFGGHDISPQNKYTDL